MEFVPTNKGARCLIYQGYKYHIYRRGRDEHIYWRYARSRSCSGRVITLHDELVTVKDSHSHPPDVAGIEVEKIVSALKKKVAESSQPIAQLYQNELQNISSRPDKEEIAARLPTLASLKSSLYRHRKKRLALSVPETIADVSFEGAVPDSKG